jgi:hypothetical protein
MKVYAFDVDETLDISGGPIPLSRVAELRDAGHTNMGIPFLVHRPDGDH